MSRLQNLPCELQQSFFEKSLLKVIAGLNNFDKQSVQLIARSASIGGANLLDIACDPELVRLALECSNIPICVSSVTPESFPEAVAAGATMIEIGNFDSFYREGRFFDSDEVLDLTIKTRELLPDIVLSVTVPHTLSLDNQSKLALELVDAGADLIQTEGGTSATPLKPGKFGLIEKAIPTLASVHSIAQSFSQEGCIAPVICASGLSEVTVPMALASGASGVGIGSAINRLENELEMIAMIRTLKEATISANCLALKSI